MIDRQDLFCQHQVTERDSSCETLQRAAIVLLPQLSVAVHVAGLSTKVKQTAAYELSKLLPEALRPLPLSLFRINDTRSDIVPNSGRCQQSYASDVLPAQDECASLGSCGIPCRVYGIRLRVSGESKFQLDQCLLTRTDCTSIRILIPHLSIAESITCYSDWTKFRMAPDRFHKWHPQLQILGSRFRAIF